MQQNSHNHNNFIYNVFLFRKLHVYSRFDNQILDSLIKYLMDIKDKQVFIDKLNIFIKTKSISQHIMTSNFFI